MKSGKYEINMTTGSLLKNIILFTIPLVLSNLLQIFYNAADMIVVSRWAGSMAMASVGSTGSLNALIVNGCIGLSLGTSVLVSRYYGAHDSAGVYRAVHTSMLLSLFVGLFSMTVGYVFAPTILRWTGTPEGEVLDGAVRYMRIYFLGVPATMVYNFGASILRAVGDTKRPLYILASTGVINVILNLILVIVFHMGVAGVAIATLVANVLSAAAVLASLIRTEGVYKLFVKKVKIYKEELTEVFRIGLPAALQSMMFSLSNTVIQSAVNSFGADAIAGCAAGSNIEGFVYTGMYAFHQASLTAVSQNYGAKDEKRVKKAVGISIVCVSVVGITLGLLTVIFARPLLGIYITDSISAIDYGIIRMVYTGLPYFLCGIMDVMAGALRGLGYSSVSAINSLLGACGTRLLWVTFILPLNRTIEMLFVCWPLSWIIVLVLHFTAYMIVRKKAFAKISLRF